MGKSLMIAVGTSSYAHLPQEDQRPQLAAVVQSIVQLFTGPLQYQRELEAIGENPDASMLRKALDRWFGAEERDGADWVVLYYTGHGEVVGGDSLYLLTSDYEPGQYVGTAFSLRQLADMVLAKRADGRSPRKISKLLVIIDVCFAGQGTLQLAQVLSNVFRTTTDSMFYLLGAALPREEAQAGALAAALSDAVHDLSTRYVQQPFLYFDQLVPAINQRLRLHRAVLSPILSPSEEPRFFPNRNFQHDIQSAVLASEAQRAIMDRGFRAHWNPQASVYFSGRAAVLAKLRGFLKSTDDSATRVITGRPGAGKSAILSRLVMLAEAASRERLQGLSGDMPLPAIDLAVDAKGKSAADLTKQFAAFLGVEDRSDRVIAAFRSLARPVRIVVDSLDEAAQPNAIAADLLRPCSAIDAVKLLVGTRKEYAHALEASDIIDIDTPEHAERADIVQYVESRLLAEREPGVSSPYAGQHALAHRVAEAVAEKAHPNFLVARLIVEDLLSRPHLVDVTVSEQITFPSTIGRAFRAYLRRFGADQRRVRDVLLPLAYAKGEGLPWDNIWAPLAAALARRPYSDGDIQWVLEHAGAFILEVADKGRSVYRLYHEALAHALRSSTRQRGLQETFVTVLIESVPWRVDAAGPDWQLANPYVRTHLATHAAACGRLAELLADPLFLLAADPAPLQASLGTAQAPLPREIVDVYQRTVHHLHTKPLAEAASYLELAAHQSGALDFAEHIARLPLQRPWSVGWVHWQPANMYRIVARHAQGYVKVALSQMAGQPVVVSKAHDNTIQVTRLVDGVALGAPWQIESGPRVVLWAIGELHGQPVVVSRGAESILRIWLLHDGTLLQEIPTPPSDGEITALVFTTLDGRPVAVTGDNNGTISVWDLRTAQALGQSRARHRSVVRALAIGELPQGPVIVSTDRDGTVRRWELRTVRALGKPLQPFSHGHEVYAMATSTLTERPVVLCAGHYAGIWVADLASGKPVSYAPLRDERWFGADRAYWCLALGRLANNRPVVVAGGYDGVIRLWDVTDGTLVGRLAGHDGFVNSVAIATHHGRPVIISGGGHDNTVRVWELGAEVSTTSPELQPRSRSHIQIQAVAVGQRDGQPVVWTATFEAVQAWSLLTGMPVRAPRLSRKYWSGLIAAFGHYHSRMVFASGLDRVRVWDLATGTRVGRAVDLPAGARSLTLGTVDGRLCLVCLAPSYSSTTLCLCDPETGRLTQGPTFAKSLYELALGTLDGRAVIALSGLPDKVEIRAFADAELGFQLLQTLRSPHRGMAGIVDAITFGNRGGRTIIATGNHSGIVELWHPDGTKEREFDLGANVTALAFGELSVLVVGTAMGLIVLHLSEDA